MLQGHESRKIIANHFTRVDCFNALNSYHSFILCFLYVRIQSCEYNFVETWTIALCKIRVLNEADSTFTYKYSANFCIRYSSAIQ